MIEGRVPTVRRVWCTPEGATVALRLEARYDWGPVDSTRVTVPAPRDTIDLPAWWEREVRPLFRRMIGQTTYVATVTGCAAWSALASSRTSWRIEEKENQRS